MKTQKERKTDWKKRKIREPKVGKSLNKYLVGKRMTVKLGG